jgi:3-phenylpropionate/trans-cinnamate dioxygenase ferredoxin subunit
VNEVRLCDVPDVPVGEAKRFAVADQQVAVVNLGEDGFRAIDAVCSHEHYFLDEGDVDVDEGTIECPKHGSLFDVGSGKPLGLPAIKPVATFAVTLTDDAVWIEV